MRNLFIAAALLASAAPVHAQEWDGWFAGFDAGYITRSISGLGGSDFNYDGPTIGLVAGHWWRLEPIYLGFEGGLGLGGAAWQQSYITPPPLPSSFSFSSSEMVTVSARAKIGAPVGNYLLFASAGLQYVHSLTRYESTFLGSTSTSTSWGDQAGATASIGAEYKFTPSLAGKVEAGVNAFWPTDLDSYGGFHLKTGLNYYFD